MISGSKVTLLYFAREDPVMGCLYFADCGCELWCSAGHRALGFSAHWAVLPQLSVPSQCLWCCVGDLHCCPAGPVFPLYLPWAAASRHHKYPDLASGTQDLMSHLPLTLHDCDYLLVTTPEQDTVGTAQTLPLVFGRVMGKMVLNSIFHLLKGGWKYFPRGVRC